LSAAPSSRRTARATLGGGLPIRTLSVVRRVHSSPWLPFPFSPLLIPDGRISRVRLAAAASFTVPLPCGALAQVLAHVHPRIPKLWVPLRCSLAFVAVLRLSVRLRAASQPLPTESPFARRTVLPPTPCAQAQVGGRYPAFIAPTGSCARPPGSRRLRLCLFLRVFAGCVESLLPVGPSRRYLCDPCTVAWIRTPPRSGGASVRFFPPVLGLSIGSTASARGTIPQRSFVRGRYFGAATIRLCSGSATRLAHSLLRRSGLCVPAAAGPYTPRCTHAVTGRGLRHRYVSESDN